MGMCYIVYEVTLTEWHTLIINYYPVGYILGICAEMCCFSFVTVKIAWCTLYLDNSVDYTDTCMINLSVKCNIYN